MVILNQTQLQSLQGTLDVQGTEAFYNELYSYGDEYGRLGAGVSANNTPQGKLANNFLKHAAENNGKDFSYGSDNWNDLNLDLAQAYLNEYNNNNGSQPTGEKVRAFHNEKYVASGLDEGDWIVDKMLEDSGNANGAYSDYLENDGLIDFLDDMLEILDAMVSDNFFSASENAEAADYNLNLLMALADLNLQDIENLLNEYAEFENLKEALEAVKDIIDSASNEVDGAGNWLKNLLDNLFNGNNSNADDGTMGPFLPTSGNGPEDQGSPLVIDLDGDGIELYAAGTYGTYFDLRGDGQAVLTGWVSPDDGLLAVDTNNNGRIDDIGELFGSMSAQGFGELAALDLNADGVIDANDAGFADLLVWRDLNSDGVSQAAELQSLSGLDITSISLDVTRMHQEVGGNTITHEADIIIGGVAHTIADAWFAYDAHMTRNSAAYDLDIRAAFLPTLRGFGDLKDLHIAASLDNGAGAETLMSRLIDFANGLSLAGAIADWPASVAAAEGMLYRWAGVETVSPTGRGAYVDGWEFSAFFR